MGLLAKKTNREKEDALYYPQKMHYVKNR
jgi:hypothetical protein